MLATILFLSTSGGCVDRSEVSVVVHDAVTQAPIERANVRLFATYEGGWFAKNFVGTMYSPKLVDAAATDQQGRAVLRAGELLKHADDVNIDVIAEGYSEKSQAIARYEDATVEVILQKKNGKQ
jgi:hypothetical protein